MKATQLYVSTIRSSSGCDKCLNAKTECLNIALTEYFKVHTTLAFFLNFGTPV